MKTNRTKVIRFTMALLVGVCCAWPAMAADDDAAALAKAAQNPVASLISVPIQLNMNFGTGPEDDLQTVTNIQPVVPFSLGENWNLITRTILPVISQPDFGVYSERENGIGDIQFSTFLSPKEPTSGGWIWGAGAIAQLDTATDDCFCLNSKPSLSSAFYQYNRFYQQDTVSLKH
jgi:hypothetical protein